MGSSPQIAVSDENCPKLAGYCPHPVTVYQRGNINGRHIWIVCFIQLLLGGSSTQQIGFMSRSERNTIGGQFLGFTEALSVKVAVYLSPTPYRGPRYFKFAGATALTQNPTPQTPNP